MDGSTIIEKPLYTLPQVKKRLIIPKLVSFFLLGIIFYLGIILNMSLLNLTGKTKNLVLAISLILLVFLIIFGIIYNLLKTKKEYLFYKNKIIFWKKEIPYKLILNMEIKRNFLDKIFKTYSLQLTKKFSINNIPETIQIKDYLQKLINYNKKYNQSTSTLS